MAETIQELGAAGGVHRMIRCRNTQRYFKDGDWTDDPVQASTFEDQIEAIRVCVAHGLNDIELVLRARGSHAELFCTPIR